MNSIYNVSAFYNLFKSPVSLSNSNPVTNLAFSYKSGELFSKGFGKQIEASMSQYLSNVNSSTEQLKEASKDFLINNPQNVFNTRTFTTDDKSSVTGNAFPNAEPKVYTLNINNLATNQINTGNTLSPEGVNNFTPGINKFNINIGNKTYPFDLYLDPNDQNNKTLNKIAQAINDEKIGITATVESANNQNYLKLLSNKTGTPNSFSINDLDGNAVAASGINQITQIAENAKYKLNNIEYTNSSNTISIDNNLNVTLKKAEQNNIQLQIDIDKQAIKKSIEKLVMSYNSLISTANNNLKSFNGASILKSDLQQIIDTKKTSLLNIGLYSKNDDLLEIDYEKLDKTIGKDINIIKDSFGLTDNLAEQLVKKGSEIISSPIKYSKPASFDKNYESYMNYMKLFNNSTSTNYLGKGKLMDVLL